MPAAKTRKKTSIRLATALDAGSVTEAYTKLLSLLDKVETSEAKVFLDLENTEDDVSALSLQLLISAAGSFPTDRLSLGPGAVSALATLENPQEI